MPRPCSVCGHPERMAIEDALFRNNVAFRNVSKRYGVTVSALFRHKQHAAKQRDAEPKVQQTDNAVPTGSQLAAELPPKKRAYVEGRIQGKSRRQAALSAGYSVGMASRAAKKIETKDVRQAFAALIRETIPPERIVKAIEEGLGAVETKFFSHEGVVQDERDVVDWSERRAYAQLAAEYGAYHAPPDKSDRDQGSGVLIILPRPAGEAKTGETGMVIEGETKEQAAEGVIVALPRGTDADSD